MVRQDILGGLKEALSRGQSLRHAMITFLNAGYKKLDIEGAAKVLLQEQQQMRQIMPQAVKPVKPVQPKPIKPKPVFKPKPQPITKPKVIPGGMIKPIHVQKPSTYSRPSKPLAKPRPTSVHKPIQKPIQFQRVSAYAPKQNLLKEQVILGLLIFIEFVLLGLLSSTIIFKVEVMSFLNKLFGI